MADVKVSGLPSDSSLDSNHYTIINDPTGPTTKRTLLSTLAAFFFNQVNIPDGSGSPRTRMTEQMFDFIASGIVWSGDAYASTRLASMTAGVVYINGRRLIISAVVSRTFTASRDTYIDILDNGDGTATIVYTEVTNNNTSPALAANSMRIGIIVTGASNIAAVGSVNQGQEDKILPIISSVPMQVTDSLGNLVGCRDPQHRTIGYRQLTNSPTTSSTSITNTNIEPLTVPVKIPTGRKIKASLHGGSVYASGTNRVVMSIYEGTVAGGTKKATGWAVGVNSSFSATGIKVEVEYTPTTANLTFQAGWLMASGGTGSIDNDSTLSPMFLRIELA